MADKNGQPTISVIIPCRNEEYYMVGCLDSIIASDYPKSNMEVLIFDGMSSDKTVEIVEHYADQYPYIKLYENPHRTVPYAMNAGIRKATGDYIIRLDAHSHYPADYFSKLVRWSQKLNADNVGALWITEVKHKNPKSLSIKSVLSSSYGVGNALFRTGVSTVKEVDTVPFGCYPNNVFKKYGTYNEKLTRNQDIELNKRIKQQGGKIYLVPDIQCTYFARETFKAIAHNNYRNGHWNILTVYITHHFSSLGLRHFIPLGLILALLLPLLGGIFFQPVIAWLTALVLLVYGIFVTVASARLKNKENSFPYLWWSFIVLHFSYGWGSLTGLFRIGKIFGR